MVSQKVSPEREKTSGIQNSNGSGDHQPNRQQQRIINICSFVHQCNIHFLLFIIRRHVSASHGHLQVL
jgi:hypothetical protein